MAPTMIAPPPVAFLADVGMIAPKKTTIEVDTDNWPHTITDNAVWHGDQFADSTEYIYSATLDDIAEVEKALENFKALELDGPDVSRDTFQLPTVGPKLFAATNDVHTGRGFFIIRGLDPKKYTTEDNVLIFLGLSSYVGEKLGKQDHHGSMIVHVLHDKVFCPVLGEGITQLSNKASAFHTEFFCDLVGFQVRSLPASGGFFKVASIAQIYNVLRGSRPDLVEALAQPDWEFEARGKLFPAHHRAILYYHDGRVMFDFSQRPLLNVTPKQQEALDALQALATQNEISYEPEIGDISFINNHAVVHARTAFTDDETHSRHIVRLWLKNQRLQWKLPSVLQEGNARIYENDSIPESWAVDYVPRVPLPWNAVFSDTSH